MGAMPVGVFVLDVDDADHLPLGHDGHGEKGLVAVFGQIMEELETRIIAGVAGDGHGAALLGHPAGDPFSQAQPDVPDQFGVRVLGGSEHELVSARVQQVDEAGIRLGDLDGDVHDVMEDGVEIQVAADRIADLVEDFRFACLLSKDSLKGGHGSSTMLLHPGAAPYGYATIAQGGIR